MNLVEAGWPQRRRAGDCRRRQSRCAPATGHRICNDCMKACIYQKQEPVDIPAGRNARAQGCAGAAVGFRDLLAAHAMESAELAPAVAAAASGRYKVLVVGLGPAGFTLAHHLINDGHTVVGVDGLKIEPLTETFQASTPAERVPRFARSATSELHESLDDARHGGFRRGRRIRHHRALGQEFPEAHPPAAGATREFAMFGGVRFGGTLTIDSAFELGFDHIALCAGAGRPTIVPMKNGLARGVRQASDFLMALQLTGAAKSDSLANLQIRLPVVVIGGGLTAIDTATEALAYYPLQVEKFLDRYETLVAERGAGRRACRLDRAGSGDRGRVFSMHARAIRAERERARRERCSPQLAGAHPPVGRRHHSLSAAADRFAELYAQPRGGREGAGGGDQLRRAGDAGRGSARSVRLRARAASVFHCRNRKRSRCAAARCDPAGTHDPGSGGNAAQHRARARATPACRDRRQVFPGFRRGGP